MKEKTKIIYNTFAKMMKPENNRFNYAVGEITPLDNELRQYAKSLDNHDLEEQTPHRNEGIDGMVRKGIFDVAVSGTGALTVIGGASLLLYDSNLSVNIGRAGAIVLLAGIIKFGYDSLKAIASDTIRENFLKVKSARELSGEYL